MKTSNQLDASERLYGAAVRDAEHLGSLLETREQPMIVVTARDATEFLPYGRAWYENQFVYDVPLEAFDRADRLQLTVKADQVRMI